MLNIHRKLLSVFIYGHYLFMCPEKGVMQLADFSVCKNVTIFGNHRQKLKEKNAS